MATKTAQDLSTLKVTVSNILELIGQLQKSTPPAELTTLSNHADVNAVELAHDTSKLIRAHTTKLSLLIINKPFTASAINTVLRELVAGPLPGLASAAEICHATKYTKLMSEELRYRTQKVFIEFSTLVKEIPLDGNVLSEDQKNGTGSVLGRGSLAVTGVVWEACDALIELKATGIAGLMIKRVDEYRDLLKDALEEIQEWGEESDNEDAAAPDPTPAVGDYSSVQHEVDEMFGARSHIPEADPDSIRPRLYSAQKRLRMIILMYQAVVKRRLKTLPPLLDRQLPLDRQVTSDHASGVIRCLDEVLGILKKIPDITDELANAFYELDADEIDKRIEQCSVTAFTAVELLMENWEGGKDEFSTWASKFQLAMKKGW